MRKWFKKNENALTKLGAILFILSFIDLFTIEGNILSIIIVIWLFYSIYKQGGLFNDYNYLKKTNKIIFFLNSAHICGVFYL